MKGAYSGSPGVDWHLAKGSCHFYGTPHECQGELTVINVSNDKVKVRALSTQKPSRQRKDALTLQPTYLALSARVPPHSETRTLASLQLPPETAPGQYQATVICGKQKLPIEVKILEHREASIEPSHLRVQGKSGDTVNTKLCITNLGNVALDLRDIGMVWLREYDWIGRTLVYTLRETDTNDRFEDFSSRLLHTFHNDMIPPAKIQFKPSAEGLLSAGSAMLRTLSITLPSGLKKGRRYSGFIKINEIRIWLEVYCSGSGSAAHTEKQP